MRARALLLVSCLLAVPATAQVRPQAGPGDPRLQTVAYDANQVVELAVGTGYQLTIELAPDEHIEDVAVGDSSAWQVSADKRGDHLFIKDLAPVSTDMIVLTDARRYAFDLIPSSGTGGAYLLHFTYQGSAASGADAQASAEPVMVRYFMSGSKLLRPTQILEDGIHTYLTFPADQPLPAVFMLDRLGHETLINGAMRDGKYVIDAIASELIFKLDKDQATAKRIVEKDGHG
jgi:type IV secretion system protein VirB9